MVRDTSGQCPPLTRGRGGGQPSLTAGSASKGDGTPQPPSFRLKKRGFKISETAAHSFFLKIT